MCVRVHRPGCWYYYNMSDEENDVKERASARDVLNTAARVAGQVIGSIIAVAVGVIMLTGAGLAVGRAAEIAQGAMSQPNFVEVMVDGWAILFAAYLVIWLPLSVLLRDLVARDE